MHLNLLKPKQSINKAYLKEKVSRSAIDLFKENFSVFLEHTNSNIGDEEHLKSQVMFFLRDTWFKDTHHINPIGKNDLVIHNGKSTSDTAGVLIEVKSITNKTEMLTADRPNVKALHELVLYYLRERIDHNNNEIKYLIATNIDDWYIFDANEFDKKIFRNTAVKKLYELKKTDNKDNPFFYEELRKLLNGLEDMVLEATHFQLRAFETIVSNADTKDDNKLIAIYKLLSPTHLLKLSFANDSNSLQPKFYSELLHLIGLSEVKEGSKKLIQRKKEGLRDPGSLLENTIIQLESHDKLSRLDKPSQYGETKEERLYTVALELVITWVNRILFLKLLEAQLISYHKGDKVYAFLNREKIRDFDDLDKLFFRVLAKLPEERSDDIQKLFGRVPYLNSSLFEPTELEHQTLFINGLEDFVQLPLISSTVLKDIHGKSLKSSLITLDYLFGFLDAYDFSSEGAEDIQEDNKTLINASVLGLIFEKINGYKDGSFFTPGFITMYMCRETIRRAVVQKFNDTKGWDCKELTDLYNKIEDNKEANAIINSLKICDPAVGSGHFLVSALNEIIAIKADLNILLDREGRRLKEYQVEVVNDELAITDENGSPFSYNPDSKESQRVQEALFHEKQTIIENCLFGVDINSNSVKICRLRLWIELLKNAYYKPYPIHSKGDVQVQKDSLGGLRHLETLPNIDINIKTGNSLISRFALDADLKKALKKSGHSIEVYRIAVQTYKNARNKEEKREMEKLISIIKNNFRTEIGNNHPLKLKIKKIDDQIYLLAGIGRGGFGMLLFDEQAEYKDKNFELRKQKIEELTKLRKKHQDELDEIENSKIYENAFEWRFEFPEVLSNEGDFVGFDVVIGNPPYIQQRKLDRFLYLLKDIYKVYSGTADLSIFFFELGMTLLKSKGILNLITTNKFFKTEYGVPLRKYLESYNIVEIVNFEQVPIFDEALVSSTIIIIVKSEALSQVNYILFQKELLNNKQFEYEIVDRRTKINILELKDQPWLFRAFNDSSIIDKISKSGRALGTIPEIDIRMGIKSGFDEAFWISTQLKNTFRSSYPNLEDNIRPILRGKDIKRFTIDFNNIWLLYIPWHFPLQNQEVKGSSVLAENTFKNNYPLIYNHLLSYKSKLENRNKAETGITYEWYALQRSGSTFFENFLKEKIVWGLISGHWNFAYDNSKYLITSASYMLVSEIVPIKYILAILNSKVTQYFFNKVGEKTAGGAYVFKKSSIEKIIIPDADPDKIDQIINLVNTAISQNLSSRYIVEKQLDQLVYQLYGLTEEEIKIVEGEE